MKIPIDQKEFLSKTLMITIIVISCLLIGYVSVIFLGKDNPIEQEVEKIIEAETSVVIDLTPKH